jgi:hypothetical protein
MARPHPCPEQASGEIFKDDVNGFFLYLENLLHDPLPYMGAATGLTHPYTCPVVQSAVCT